MSKFQEIGRLAAEEILQLLAREPSALEKAIEIALGAIAVLDAADERITAPMLLANSQIKKALEEEKIGEPTFRAGLTEARKRWKAEQERQRSAQSGSPRAKSHKARSNRGRSKPAAENQVAPVPIDTGEKQSGARDSTAAEPAKIAEELTVSPSKSAFVEDVNIEDL